MNLSFVPLISAMLPGVAVHLCYLLAAYLGHVPWCFPYIDGCTSISATGRVSPENYIFRAAMIPTAVVMIVYWKLSYDWLKTIGSRMSKGNRVMLCLGVIACLGLIVYTTVLGSIGEIYRLQRRIGITLFYISTFLAQLIMTGQIAFAVKARPSLISAGTYRSLLAICAAISTLGIISLLLWAFYKEYYRIEDAFEWTLTLLILLHFFTTYFAWRDSGFKASFKVSTA